MSYGSVSANETELVKPTRNVIFVPFHEKINLTCLVKYLIVKISVTISRLMIQCITYNHVVEDFNLLHHCTRIVEEI